MKNINLNERLIQAMPFTEIEIYFRLDKKVEIFSLSNRSDAVQRFAKCVTSMKIKIGDTPFSAELSCKALRYGSSWTHVKQLIVNQKIA